MYVSHYGNNNSLDTIKIFDLRLTARVSVTKHVLYMFLNGRNVPKTNNF